MKRYLTLALVVISLCFFSMLSFSQPNYSLAGYASMNGGTTGGEGGVEYYASDYSTAGYPNPGEYIYELLRGHRQTQKTNPNAGIIIYVDTKIDEDNFGRSKMDLKDISNVSVIGVCNLGEFKGVGWTISRASNVIIRNLIIHHVRQGSGTCIELTTNSHNIWIDRNEFYATCPSLNPDKDYYDGLVDIKRNVQYVTVSWNVFRDHWKACLLNHTDNESLAAHYITYHHNLFMNINSRLPLIRYATAHLFNNYYVDILSSAINCRVGAQVRVDNNYFENTGSGTADTYTGLIQGPVGWWYGSPSTGYWHTSGNILVNSPNNHMASTTTVDIPYAYGHVLHDAADVPTVVTQYAGAGKLLCISPEDDATLSDLRINDVTVIGFNPEVYEYDVELPYGTTNAPTVTATPSHSEASLSITQATSLPGDATVEVTSESGDYNLTYTISFSLYDPADDATLSDLTVNGNRVVGFSRFVTEYTLNLPYGTTTIPAIGATPYWSGATIQIAQATTLPGIATVDVLAEDNVTSLIYSVHINVLDPSEDSELDDLILDGISLDAFSASIYEYILEYPDGTTEIPVVSASPSDDKATVTINQAQAMPGTATVQVLAEDGTTTSTYTIHFNLISTWKIYDASVLPNVSSPSFITSDWANNPDFSIVDDPLECKPSNTHLQMITSPASSKGNWRYNLPSGQSEVTIVARVKALSADYGKALVIDMQFGGSRERIYINTDNTYWLRHAGQEDAPLPGNAQSTDWNIFRLTKSGSNVSFYFNENPVPVETVTTTTSTSNNYFRFGDPFGDQSCGALTDWLIWDETGAFAPGEGSSIPHWLCSQTGPPPPADDATLADLLVNGTTIFGFDPSIISYDYTLPQGVTDIPEISAVANNSRAQVVVTQASAVPGDAAVEVTSEDEQEIITYTVSLLPYSASNDATLAGLTIDGTTVLGFESDIYEYTVVLPHGTTSVPVVGATTNYAQASLNIEQALAIPSDAVVTVTSEEGSNTLTYTISFVLQVLSNDATLADLKVDGVSVDGFSRDVYEYTLVLPQGTTDAPLVGATTTNPSASLVYTQATAIPGSAVVTVNSEDGLAENTYTVSFIHVLLSDDATLADLTVDGTTVLGFNPHVTDYTIVLPYGTESAPIVGATPTDSAAIIAIDQATSLPGNAIVVVTPENSSSTVTYTVSFAIEPLSADATLSNLTVDGVTVNGFSPEAYLYNVMLATGTTNIPTVDAVPNHPAATISIAQAEDIPGSAVVSVTPQDSSAIVTYTISFARPLLSSDATIANLTVGGAALADFSPDVYEYTVELPIGTPYPPVIMGAANHSGARLSITLAQTIPGSSVITVTAQDRLSISSYTVSFVYETLSNDATLASLTLDGVLLSGFSPNIFEYTVELPNATATPPVLGAVVNHPDASIEINQAQAVPGTSTVTVTAQDGQVSNVYAVSFIEEAISSSIFVEHNVGINIYPNPVTNGLLNIVLNGTNGPSTLRVIDVNGRVLIEMHGVTQQHIELPLNVVPGTYLIQLVNNKNSIVRVISVQ